MRGEVLRGLADDDTGYQAHDDGAGHPCPIGNAEHVEYTECGHGDEGRRDIGADTQGTEQLLHAGSLPGLHEIDTDDGQDDTYRSNEHGSKYRPELHRSIRIGIECRGTECGGGQDRAAVGLIEVSAHAGHVTHVVTHIVGDGSGVAGIVLGDTGLYLTDEVGAHVSGLGIDTAAHTGKQRLCRGSHSEGQHGGGDYHQFLGTVSIDKMIQDEIPYRNIQQAESHHRQTHDGTGAEGKLKTGVERAAGGIGSPAGSVGGGLHSDETGQAGEESSGEECKGHPPVLDSETVGKDGKEDGQNDEHDGHHLVLLLEIGHGALADVGGNLTHGGRTLVLLEHPSIEIIGKAQGNQG